MTQGETNVINVPHGFVVHRDINGLATVSYINCPTVPKHNFLPEVSVWSTPAVSILFARLEVSTVLLLRKLACWEVALCHWTSAFRRFEGT